MSRRKRILIAPLDWGLGHATRCIPIINELLRYDLDIVIASDGRPFELLRREFQDLECVRLPGYSIRYVDEGNLAWAIIKQLPQMMKSFDKEHDAVEKIILSHQIDAVISDSRFGVFSENIPSIFIIHQLNILLPSYLQWAENFVTTVVRYRCNKFSECWVPDFEGSDNLAGNLSHPHQLPKNTFYIGPVSRLSPSQAKKEIDILAIISGPEPQRTMFEQIVIDQIQKSKHNSIVVRGKPEVKTRLKFSENIILVNTLPTNELSKAISLSNIVISRPGYTTVMDLSFTGANAIFVPTPQQTEQKYLAKELMKKNLCYSESQDEFSLERSLEKSKNYAGLKRITNDYSILHQRIEHLLNRIGY